MAADAELDRFLGEQPPEGPEGRASSIDVEEPYMLRVAFLRRLM